MSIVLNKNAVTMETIEDPDAPQLTLSEALLSDFEGKEENTSFGANWRIKLQGSKATLKIESLSKLKIMQAWVHGWKALNHPEIHIAWKPYIPNLDEGWTLSATLRFEPSNTVMQSAVIGLNNPAHIVFYPNHSAPLEKGGKLPWEIDFVIEDSEIKEGTTIADIWVELRCKLGSTACHTTRRDAVITALVPTDEEFTGVSLSRDYKKTAPLKMAGYQLAANSMGERKKLLFLNEIGVDIKGLSMGGYLKNVLKSITSQDLKNKDAIDIQKNVLNKIRDQIGGSSSKMITEKGINL